MNNDIIQKITKRAIGKTLGLLESNNVSSETKLQVKQNFWNMCDDIINSVQGSTIKEDSDEG